MADAGTLAQRVTLVVVCHNSGLVIENLLRSIPQGLGLICVDNACTDDTISLIRQYRPDATILHNATGQGYARAANRGLRAVETEFALLANPDTVLSEDALLAMLAAADRFPEAAIIGPVHRDGKGHVEPSHDVALWDRRGRGKRGAEPVPEGPLCAEFISGAVTFLRMAMGRAIGFYDEDVFLYYEDDDFCLRLRQAGHLLIVDPAAVVVHLGGGSVRPSKGYAWEKFWHLGWSRIHFEAKHHGRAAAFRTGVILAARYFTKALAASLVFNRKKAGRDWARCAGTLAALRGVKAHEYAARMSTRG